AAGDKALGVDLNDVGRVYTFVKSPGSLSLLDSDSSEPPSANLTGWGSAWHPDEDYVVVNRPRGSGAVLAWSGAAFSTAADGPSTNVADLSSTPMNVQFSPGGDWIVYLCDDGTYGG
ncbi:hypothetical protein SB781_32475, partial [Paraburkholderia sp. SIMBA_061]